MQKTLTILIIIFFVVSGYSQNKNSTINKAAKLLADKTISEMQKNNLPADSKLAIMNFYFGNNYSDSLKSEAGVDFSKAYAHFLQEEIQNKKLDYEILSTNKEASQAMGNFFSLPEGTDRTKFWKNYLVDNTPDFHISGVCNIDEDYKYFKTANVRLNANKFDTDLKEISISIPNISVSIQNNEKQELLKYETVTNLEELSEYIAYQLKFQTNIKNIQLQNIEYKQTGLATPFSYELNNELQNSLIKIGNYKLEPLKERNTRGIFSDKRLHILSGTYSNVGDKIKVNITLTNAVTGKIIATVKTFLSENYIISKNIEYKPAKIEKVKKEQNRINENKIVNSFKIDVWTNKGNKNVIFKQGDTLNLYILSEEPCYLRFVYMLADGTTVLLADNIYIDQSKVGQDYKIPENFICSEPFGVETLILNAQNTKFKALNTYSESGYEFITDDLDEILKNTRGFKKEVKHAEKIIQITTIK